MSLRCAALALVLAACAPPVDFAIDSESASTVAEKTDRAIDYSVADDFRATVTGPHAVGARIPIVASRPFAAMDQWAIEVGPPEQASLVRRFDQGDSIRLQVDLLAEGVSEVDLLDPNGNIEGTLEMEARPVAGAVLQVFDDLIVGAPEVVPVAPDGVIRIVDGFEATLVVVWLDAEGTALTGTNLLTVELLDPLQTVRVVSVRSTDVPGLDAFTIHGDRPSQFPPAQLTVRAGGVAVGTWSVDVLAREMLNTVTLVHQQEYGPFGLVGFVQALARDRFGNRIVGPELDWANNGEPLLGAGSYVPLVDGCDSYVQACSPVNGVCAGTTVQAEALVVGTSQARPPIECSHGGAPPAVGLALVALLAVAARRRASVVALGLWLWSAAAAQEPEPPTEIPSPTGTPVPVPSVPVAGEPSGPRAQTESDFSVRPVIAWGLHSPKSSLRPVNSNFVLGLTAKYGAQRDWVEGIEIVAVGQATTTIMFGNIRRGWEVRGTGLMGLEFTRGKRGSEIAFAPLAGLELIGDHYRFYCRSYGSALMVSVPMMARARLAAFTFDGGVAPSWFLTAPARDPVDWKVQDLKGFGDEFEFRAGLSIQIDEFNVAFNLRTRVASYGDESWLALGLAYSAFF